MKPGPRHVILLLLGSLCLVLLLVGMTPGLLGSSLAFVLVLISFGLPLPIWGLLLLVLLALFLPKLQRVRVPWRAVAIGVGMLVITGLLLRFEGPARLGFLASKPAFEALVPSAPVAEEGGRPLGREVGLYTVDEYGIDPRGGTFFRVHQAFVGLGPGTSYGFAFRPNPEGTPFGSLDYETWPLGDDWYMFRATRGECTERASWSDHSTHSRHRRVARPTASRVTPWRANQRQRRSTSRARRAKPCGWRSASTA